MQPLQVSPETLPKIPLFENVLTAPPVLRVTPKPPLRLIWFCAISAPDPRSPAGGVTMVYPSIRIEGGLLGPDVLDRLVAGEMPGQKPADFGLESRPPRRVGEIGDQRAAERRIERALRFGARHAAGAVIAQHHFERRGSASRAGTAVGPT